MSLNTCKGSLVWLLVVIIESGANDVLDNVVYKGIVRNCFDNIIFVEKPGFQLKLSHVAGMREHWKNNGETSMTRVCFFAKLFSI